MEYLNLQTGLTLLNSLKNLAENKNETAFNQTLELYVLSFYREGAVMLKEKLEKVASEGVDVQVLLAEAEQKMQKHFKHQSKEK